MRPTLIISWLWTLFCVVWLISAIGAKRTVSRRSGAWIFRTLVFVAIAYLISRSESRAYAFHVRVPATPAMEAIGIVCTAIGIAFAFWARFYLGRNWGMPMSVQESAELVTTGPYAYVRNPIYTGMLLALLGTAIVVGAWWLSLFAISAVYFTYSAKQEEKLLLKQFPDTFPAYRARTKMLVPFLF
ncbi:MAG: methyltransferase family protein [Gemmatimonadaceae bacterium]